MKKSQLPVKKEGERKNKDIVQSHAFTMSRYQFNLYEKRILYRTVEFLQDCILNKVSPDVNLSGDVFVRWPVICYSKDRGERKNKSFRCKKARKSFSGKITPIQ